MIEITYTDNGPTRIDRFLKTTYPTLPYSVIQKWLRTGALRLNGKRIKAEARLNQGDILKIPSHAPTSSPSSQPSKPLVSPDMKEEVRSWLIYEDEEILAFNKPAGVAVQGGTDITLPLDDLIRQTFDNPAIRVVHRLDKETSGLLIMAKDRASAQKLSLAFREHAVKKTYVALVVGTPKSPRGRIENYLLKRQDNFEKMTIVPQGHTPQGDWSITDYELKRKATPLSLIHLYPQTGRTHQLRVHMTDLGTPILGDGKYGGATAHPFAERTPLGLHAYGLVLPSGLELSAPCPTWFSNFF